MKLFLVLQNENNDYDTYDSMVVVAEDEETARDMKPSNGKLINWNSEDIWEYSSWASKRKNVKVKYLGEADVSFTERTVICSSFNAG